MSRQHDVEQLAMVVAELVDEFRTTELFEWRPTREAPEFSQRVRSEDGGWRWARSLPRTPERRVHRTVGPGLLEQLRQGPGRRRAVAKPPSGEVADAFALVADMAPTPGHVGSSGGSRSKPGSRPPAGLLAAETLADLSVAIGQARTQVRHAAGMGRGPAIPPAAMLRELLDLALRQDPVGGWLLDDLVVKVLLRRARSWSRSARVALAYDAPLAELRAWCRVCGGRLMVREDATSDVWCAGLPRGQHREGPAEDGQEWPLVDHGGCGTSWPRITWIDLLDATEAG